MTTKAGYYRKKAMSDSRFAVITEDPEYDAFIDMDDIDELEYTDFPEVVEDLSPYATSNS